MNKKNIFTLLLLTVLITSCKACQSDEKEIIDDIDSNSNDTTSLIGKVLPNWEDGYLDIHAINTGRGESMLYIFPDGTTMLVDAAGSTISPDHEIPPVPAKPNSSSVSGQTITNYVSYFIKTASNKLDYLMVSHWDNDHLGGDPSNMPIASNGEFRMVGVTHVGSNILVENIIDRGYPDYSYPSDILNDIRIENYIKFVNWTKTEYNSNIEKFRVGVTDQIILKHNTSKYNNFLIRNIVGNGFVWTGNGTETKNTLPDDIQELNAANPSENIFSLGFHLKYGLFDYFAGGDLQYNGRTEHSWKDIEASVAEVMTPVDVLKANHHATSNCMGTEFMTKLKPNSVLIHSWRDVQPNPESIGRIFNANSNSQVFVTNLTNNNKQRLGDLFHKLKSITGHIVVRVHPGGDIYTIYILDDNNEKYIVRSVFGPYQSK